MKYVLGIIMVALIFVFGLQFLVFKPLDDENNKYKLELGKKYILEKDTLTIIDYSNLAETFTLSNGKKINSELVFKNKQNDK